MTPLSESITCICGNADCTVPYRLCHCGCGRKTKIAGNDQNRSVRGRPYKFIHGHQTRINLDPGMCICGDPACQIPRGKCHCGCGNYTSIAVQSDSRRGYRNGEPVKFIILHQKRIRLSIEDAKPFKIDGVYCRLIPLTRGLYAIVDATDYEWLMQWKWNALSRKGKGYYAYRTEFRNGKRFAVPMHRMILGLAPDDPLVVDHENSVSIDNRRKNLRPATYSQNQMNRISNTNTSGRKGVMWSKLKKKWIVRINANRMVIDLGSSDSFDEACRLREEGERLYHGKFACAG